MKSRSLVESFDNALAGVIHALRTQRNFRIHCFMAVLVFLLGYFLPLSRVEMAVLILTIGLVLVAELVNTAVEATVDLVTAEYHHLAKIAKNVAAAAVLLAAGAAVAIGFLLFFDKLALKLEAVHPPTSDFSSLLLLMTLVVIIIGVVLGKVLGGYHQVEGGMPSGHVAVAFGLATFIYLISGDGRVTLLAAILAALVAQSRLESGVHSWLEIAVGGTVGTLVALLVFRLLAN